MTATRLKIESGEGRGRELELTRELIIGRATGCDLVLNDESCSRMHVRIVPDGDRARVEDMGSTNGTLVNGERVAVATVQDGDTIVVGGTTLLFLRPLFDAGATVILAAAARRDARVVAEVRADQPDATGTDHAAVLHAAAQLLDAAAAAGERRVVARALCQHLAPLVGADRTAILLFRPGSPDPLDAQLVSVPDIRLDPGHPWVHQAMITGRALLLQDVEGKHSLFGMVIPVRDGAEPRMLVYADRRRAAFCPEELARALWLVRLTVGLDHGARIHERLRDELIEHRSHAQSERRIVGESPSHQEVVQGVRRNAPGSQPVLFIGETGTGKELFARLLHDLSPRAAGPFVTVNCSATPEGLLDGEVFGVERGGTSFGVDRGGALERARGGTLFLDEIDAMDLPSQARLAKALREKRLERGAAGRQIPLDLRLVAASDRNLSSRARNGAFHEDLLALLAVGTVPVPPLRERQEDIPLLADHFLKTHARRMNRTARRLSGEALHALTSYEWPGNVRELSNVIERAVVLSHSEEIGPELLPFAPGHPLDPIDLSLPRVEKVAIERALAYCGYRKGQAAKLLGISWPTLNKKIGDYGIVLPQKP